jgi:hypothetical protein
MRRIFSQVSIGCRMQHIGFEVAPGGIPVDTVYGIRFPPGTTVYIGSTGSQGGIYVGGSGAAQTQIFVPRTSGGSTVNSSPVPK